MWHIYCFMPYNTGTHRSFFIHVFQSATLWRLRLWNRLRLLIGKKVASLASASKGSFEVKWWQKENNDLTRHIINNIIHCFTVIYLTFSTENKIYAISVSRISSIGFRWFIQKQKLESHRTHSASPIHGIDIEKQW